MPVPNTFGTATSAIPLSQLDSNFATPITIGNTAVQLGNTVTTLNNMTLANVTISSGTITITNVSVTTANVSGTANVSTLVVVGNATVGGNTTITGNITAANANVTSNLVLFGGTANGVAYLNTSKQVTTGTALVFNGTNLGLDVTPSAFGATYKSFQATGYAAYVGDGNNGRAEILNNAYASANNVFNYYDTNSAGRYSLQLGVHAWFTAPSGTANAAITFTQPMTLDASGNLGIGTTSFSARFNANLDNATAYANTAPSAANCTAAFTNGSGHTAGGTFVGYQLNISGNSQNRIGYFGAISESTSNQGLALVFGTNTTAGDRSEKMRLDSSGNLLVGATSNLSSAKLDVRGIIRTGSGNSSNDAELVFSNYSSATTAWSTAVRQDVGGANNDLKFLRFNSSGAFQGVAMQIDSAGGNLLVGTTSASGIITTSTSVASQAGSIWTRNTSASAAAYSGLTVGNDGAINRAGFILASSSATTSGFLAANSVYAYAGTGQFAMLTESAQPILFGTNNTERARIDSSGYLSLKYPTWNGPLINSGSGNVVSVASGGTINLTVANAGAVLICVYDTSSGNGGVFFGSYTTIITKIAGDGSATDAGSEIAVYKTANSHIITFKNRYGSTRDFSIGLYSANALP